MADDHHLHSGALQGQTGSGELGGLGATQRGGPGAAPSALTLVPFHTIPWLGSCSPETLAALTGPLDLGGF